MPILLRAPDQLSQQFGNLLHSFVACRVVVDVTPYLAFANGGLRKVRRLFQIQFHDTGSDIRAADIDRQNAVMTLEYPGRYQLNHADQAGIVRVIANGYKVDGDLVGLQQDCRAANRQFSDAVLP